MRDEPVRQQFFQIYDFSPVAGMVPDAGQILLVRNTPDFGTVLVTLVSDGVKTIQALYEEWRDVQAKRGAAIRRMERSS